MLRRPFVIGFIIFGLIATAIGASIYAYRSAYEYFANELTILPEILNQPRPISIATPSGLQDEVIVLPKAGTAESASTSY